MLERYMPDANIMHKLRLLPNILGEKKKEFIHRRQRRQIQKNIEPPLSETRQKLDRVVDHGIIFWRDLLQYAPTILKTPLEERSTMIGIPDRFPGYAATLKACFDYDEMDSPPVIPEKVLRKFTRILRRETRKLEDRIFDFTQNGNVSFGSSLSGDFGKPQDPLGIALYSTQLSAWPWVMLDRVKVRYTPNEFTVITHDNALGRESQSHTFVINSK